MNDLSDFNLIIHYKSEKNNIDADALSRSPGDINNYSDTYKEVFQAIIVESKEHKDRSEAWFCPIAVSSVLEKQEYKILQTSAHILQTVNIR